MGKHFIYIKEVTQAEIDSKSYNSESFVIEDVVTKEELKRFRTEKNVAEKIGKTLLAKLYADAIDNGTFTCCDESMNNFRMLFSRIEQCLQMYK